MKIIMLEFGQNNFAKDNIRNYVQKSFKADGLKIKAITTKSGNVKGFKVYRIGSAACIYEVDGMANKAYTIHRNKRTEEHEIQHINGQNLFEYWRTH